MSETQRRWTPRFAKNLTAIMLVIGVTLISYMQSSFAIGFDLQSARCLPWVSYLITKDPSVEVRRGAIYALHYSGDELLSNRMLLKMAAGLPGDEVRLNERGVWINGTYWGPMHPVQIDRMKTAGKLPFGEYQIPEGKLLMLGTLPQSYDGRYVGLIDTTAIEGKALPLW